MTHAVLEKDGAIPFPHVSVLKASAGSGKTYSLAERFVQFLLSGQIHQNHLRNILAITFSNNAAKEMKERILSWLKDLYFEDPKKTEEIAEIVSLKKEHLAERAGARIDDILRNYTEFQVKTIDSFMTSIYKASAIDFGYSPDFEVVMTPGKIMAYAFDRFLRAVREETPEAKFIETLLEVILDSRGGGSAYPWDGSRDLLEEIVELYSKLSGIVKRVKPVDTERRIDSVKKHIQETAENLVNLIDRSDLAKHKGSSFYRILETVRAGAFPDLVDKGLSTIPVIKPMGDEAMTRYERISKQWELLGDQIKEYIELYAATYYGPYLRAYEAFQDTLEETKKRLGVIFIDDINKKLSDYLRRAIVPDVYFRIGETIYHYLVDEFQDTSPIQWANLFPLIENSLSQGGSLLAVGDTKQAVYGFRNADYGIMKGLESKSPFSSAVHHVKELDVNYRSLEGVIGFGKTFFRKVVSLRDEYREAAVRSGLIDYEQSVEKEHRGSGYVEVTRCEKEEGTLPEKTRIQGLINDLRERGYSWSDMAVLAYRNEDVVNITAWLNEVDVPFLSYSSLDIRMRKLTAEIVALLRFLDSPPDDLSFAGFILGDIFRSVLEAGEGMLESKRLHEFIFKHRKKGPLYKAFQEEFPEVWEKYFGALFRSTGYLPLYDLVSEAYRIYGIFDRFGNEEATLVKILEVIKNFEGQGRNNLGEFLKYVSDEEAGASDWTVDVPAGVNAVKVMTLHKAKGLGFPVVIILLYEEVPRGFKYVLDEETDGVRLLKINRQIIRASNALREKYEEERLKDIVNKLNTLYVGLTRAEDELYIIGVQGKKNQFPIDLLKEMESQTGRKGVPRPRPRRTTGERMALYHPPDAMPFPVEAVEELSLEERKRGEFVHRILYFVDELEGIETELERIIQRVNEERMTDYPLETVKSDLVAFLNHEAIRPFFQSLPSRIIKKEQEFSDRRGNLLRVDRVIFEEDRIVVIDYKTGTHREAEKNYILQLKHYMSILKDIYPDRQVEGVIAYVDLKEFTRVAML